MNANRIQPFALELKRRRIPQYRVAKATGYSEAHISAVAHGHTRAGPMFRAAIEMLLGLPQSDLFDYPRES